MCHFKRSDFVSPLGILLLGFAPVSMMFAADAPKVEPPFPIAAPASGYAPLLLPADIAPTPGTVEDSGQKVEVFGQPRMAKGHPCTLWDQEDIDRYKALIKTDTNLQAMVATVVKHAEARIKQPLNVPGAHKGPDGKWMWPGDFPATEPPQTKQSTNCAQNAGSMCELGIAYVFTGEAKYADFCRQMFLAYAENYPRWARSPKATWRSCGDGRFSWQFLNDGFDLAEFGWAFDLIYNLPTFTPEEKAKVRDNFFRPAISPFFVQGVPGVDYLSSRDNRSAICAAAVLIDGYATDDQDIIDFALHGHAGTKLRAIATEGLGTAALGELGGKQDSTAPGGLLTIHFDAKALLPDGLWIEGAPGYSLGIAGCGIFDAAEVLWHHGVDMYRYRNGALKRLLDSGILLADPDPNLMVPALRDSGAFGLLDKRDWLNGEIGANYYSGYKRYRDPHYLPILQNAAEHIGMTTHSGPPFIKENLPPVSPASVVPLQNVNFYATGYGILRIADKSRTNSLLMEFGEQTEDWIGHGHPSMLGINLYAFGDTLMPFPGVIFPYNDPLDVKWYWTTLANCTMEVDQDDQLDAGDRFHKYKGAPKPTTPQTVYAPASTFGMQRAYSSSAYPGTTIDRSLFLTSRYMADLYGGFCSVPRTYDLAWHFRGTLATDLPLETFKFPEPVANGYNALDNVRHATTDKAWSAAITFHDKPLRFWGAATPTEVIIGDGHFDAYKQHPPTILERRANLNNTLFGSVMDLSGDAGGYVKGVTQEGGLEAGYGLLQVQTAQGTDLCFAAYRPGIYKPSGLETDGQQAFLRMDGKEVQAMYLAGGKILKTGAASIERSEPGLAFIEKTASGSYIVANPSSSDATITVTLPALQKLSAFSLDDKGVRTGAATIKSAAPSSFAVQLKATSKVEFAPK